jgi:hypothetical protein
MVRCVCKLSVIAISMKKSSQECLHSVLAARETAAPLCFLGGLYKISDEAVAYVQKDRNRVQPDARKLHTL